MHEREFDVVIFGVTGFAGRLVAEYLLERDAPVRWAMAGRNEAKLQNVRAELAAGFSKASEVPILVADSADRASLGALTSQTRVVCTTVGPYAKYGSELVASCVEHKTHYCDLTGEVQWIRRMVDAHHEAANANGTRIVHCCGFDSIPSDLGVHILQEAAIAATGEPVDEVKLVVMAAKGGFSGGTAASIVNVMHEAKDREVRRVLAHPYSLNPEGERSGPDSGDQMGVKHDARLGIWTGPFLMASVNTRMVRRSNALKGFRYGRDFRYDECMKFGKGPLGMVGAGAFTAGFAGFAGALTLPPTRSLITKFVLPKPGEGPSREAIESGFFKMLLDGRGGAADGIQVSVKGRRDPGYGATACMLAESAMCLALDDLETPGGVTTPSAAMGDALVERLNATDVQFVVKNC